MPEEEQAAAAEYLSSQLNGVAQQLNLIDERVINNLGVLNRDNNSRPSVAALSRNFDAGNRRSMFENAQPPDLSSDEQRRQSNQAGNSTHRPARRPLADLNRAAIAAAVDRGGLRERAARQVTGHNNSPGNSSDQLIPKHVTITPQAFLKFFSL